MTAEDSSCVANQLWDGANSLASLSLPQFTHACNGDMRLDW